MGYRVHKEENKFKVVEVVEGEVTDIITLASMIKASSISSNLNRGGGFNGQTPDFFTHRLVTCV